MKVLIFLITLPKYLCNKWNMRVIKKEAFAKGMSIRQYLASIVPLYIMDICERQKGNPKLLKATLKQFVKANLITKRISAVLFEMYK